MTPRLLTLVTLALAALGCRPPDWQRPIVVASVYTRGVQDAYIEEYACESPNRECSLATAEVACPFVLIHGWRTSVASAVSRAQRLAAILGTPNGCVLGWNGEVPYSVARSQVAPRVARALTDWLARHQPAIIIAHSMGADITLDALAELVAREPQARPAGQLILLAADVAMDGIGARLARATRRVERVTVYTTACDSALAKSRAISGVARAGSADAWTAAGPPPPGVDVVDVSTLLDRCEGHSIADVAIHPRLDGELRGAACGTPASGRHLDRVGHGWRAPGIGICR